MQDDSQLHTIKVCVMFTSDMKPKSAFNTHCHNDFVTKGSTVKSNQASNVF